MFIEGKFYTHKRMLDCVIYMVSIYLVDGGCWASVQWFTRSGLMLPDKGKIFIRKEDFSNWREWEFENEI